MNLTEETFWFRQIWFTEWDPSKVEYRTNLVTIDFERADTFTMEWEAAAIAALSELSDLAAADGYRVLFNIRRR